MPYACAVENGAVSVRPGPERAFAIVEGRQQRPFTTCDPPFSNNCRSMMVHRFDVACGGERVPWIKVVAAIRRTAFGTASLNKGHLVLARKSEASTGRAPSCSQAGVSESTRGECLPWKVARATEQAVLPQGFAPATEVGARFISGSGPAGSASPIFTLAAAQDGLPAAGKSNDLDHLVTRDALPGVDVAGLTVPAPDVASDQWVTTVVDRSAVQVGQRARNHATSNGVPDFAPWLALLMGLGLAGAYVMRVQPQGLALAQLTGGGVDIAKRVMRAGRSAYDGVRESIEAARAAHREREAEREDARQEPMLAAAAEQVRLKLARTELLVCELSKAAVLREVLNGELTVVRQRLAAAEAGLRAGPANVMKLSAQFRAIDRDIDRIQRISESAGQSFAGSRQGAGSVRMPMNAAEAYDVIGANADTSDASLKRLVDALRMAWHPDFADATKPGDLAAREERIKQINVAWDLVAAQRASKAGT